MGLDQYAYVAIKEKSFDDYYGQAEAEQGKLSRPREIAYWRKHPNLQGWMEQLWLRRLDAQGKTPQEGPLGSGFNGVELELTWADLDVLEQDIREGRLPPTQGFFFGEGSDDHYREQDLKFVQQARAELFTGLRVFYNSSW